MTEESASCAQTKVHNDERIQVRLTALGLPRRSPIQVLTEVDVAQLQCTCHGAIALVVTVSHISLSELKEVCLHCYYNRFAFPDDGSMLR